MLKAANTYTRITARSQMYITSRSCIHKWGKANEREKKNWKMVEWWCLENCDNISISISILCWCHSDSLTQKCMFSMWVARAGSSKFIFISKEIIIHTFVHNGENYSQTTVVVVNERCQWKIMFGNGKLKLLQISRKNLYISVNVTQFEVAWFWQ